MLSICPLSVVTTESLSMLEMYYATNGLRRISDPIQYLNLPNIVVEISSIIDDELTRLGKITDG